MLKEGLWILIDGEPDLTIAVIDKGIDADMILLDLSDDRTTETLRQANGGQAKIVVLCDQIELAQLDAALKEGARGLVAKTAHPAGLFQAIRSVSQGLKRLDPEIQEKLASLDAVPQSPSHCWGSLTKRQRDIAFTLCISDHTVRHHLRGIFTKLHITSRVELARYANQALSS